MKLELIARALRRIFSRQTARYFVGADDGPWAKPYFQLFETPLAVRNVPPEFGLDTWSKS